MKAIQPRDRQSPWPRGARPESPGKPATVPLLKVVAAIPCFNTESSVRRVVAGAKAYVDHVIVVDDGSWDGTGREAIASGASVKRHSRNKGYGSAIRSCFLAARELHADVLVTIDGDGQHDPEEIPRVLAPILEGRAELVIGSRFLQNGKTPAQNSIPRYRGFGISVITTLFNIVSRTKVSDSQSGFRAYNKRILETIGPSTSGMSVSIEILEKARLNNALIAEVPISCTYPSSALTMGMKAVKHGLGVALSVIVIRGYNSIRHLFRS